MPITGRKASEIARGYLWSLMIWAGFAPIMAAEEAMKQQPDGTYLSFWTVLLIACAWCVTGALLSPPVFYFVQRYPMVRPFSPWRIGRYILLLVPYLLLSLCIRSAVLPPTDPAMPSYFGRFLEGLGENAHLFAVQTWDYIVTLVAALAYQYSTRARNQELESAKLRQELAESELHALKSQLQPHFLFNTLHGISTLIEVDKARAKMMVLKLSSLLRAVIQDGAPDLIPLEEELKFVEAYLDIEKMRLEERLQIGWKVDAGTRSLLVPSLILQPLVENAIVHGVACSREGGWIEIGARRLDDRLELSVANSVRGTATPGSGLGLQNTKARLSHLYADEAAFSFEVDENGIARAVLLFPALGISKMEDAGKASVAAGTV